MPPPAESSVRCLLSAEQIAGRIAELARQIAADCAGRDVLVVGVLKGSFIFMADLIRALPFATHCDFVKASSYGMGTSSGVLTLHLDVSQPVEGRDVLLVEDIVDTGKTSAWLMDHLRQKGAAHVRLCALLDKPSRRLTPVTIDYVGFSIPDHFVVGYGIDCAEQYRQLPYVGYVPSGD